MQQLLSDMVALLALSPDRQCCCLEKLSLLNPATYLSLVSVRQFQFDFALVSLIVDKMKQEKLPQSAPVHRFSAPLTWNKNVSI